MNLPTNSTIHNAGRWLVLKARQQQARQGTQAAARNLRKQGVPLSLALAILAPRRAAAPAPTPVHQLGL